MDIPYYSMYVLFYVIANLFKPPQRYIRTYAQAGQYVVIGGRILVVDKRAETQFNSWDGESDTRISLIDVHATGTPTVNVTALQLHEKLRIGDYTFNLMQY